MRPRFAILTSMILMAAGMRLIPHPWNFTPIAAMALFGGAQFKNKWTAYLVPLMALLLSDAILGFHSTMIFVYAAFSLTVWMGAQLSSRKNTANLIRTSLLSSVVFFLVTNFGVWLVDGMYAKTGVGLGQCFIAALPFFRTTLLGDLFFNGLLFGSFALAERKFSLLRSFSPVQ